MDRQHQADLRKKLREFGDEKPLTILAHVVPGGGKSRLPGILAEQYPNHLIAWFTPRTNLRSQGVAVLKKHFGIEIRDAKNEQDPSRGFRGFIATHQALTECPELWIDELRRKHYAVIVDENHHAKKFSDGGSNSLACALGKLADLTDIWLNMTGTLETNDSSFIAGMEYRETESGIFTISPELSVSHPRWYIRYDRRTALEEKALVPIIFFHHDGPVEWDDGDVNEPVKKRRLSQTNRDEEGAALFTALKTHAMGLFENGVKHFKSQGEKLLVVTAWQSEARIYHKLLRERGIESGLAITDESDAEEQIERFKNSQIMALVTCAMAYEGMDVPEITHLICLTHIRSVPWIEQMLGRTWRQTEDGKKRQCWAFVPDDPRMNRVIERIQAEQAAAVRIGKEGPGGGKGRTGGVLALSGVVDEVTRSLLDGDIDDEETVNEFRLKIRPLIESYGLDQDFADELVEAFRLKLATRIDLPKMRDRTPAEREQDLRNQIADHCRQVDRERFNAEFGTTQSALIRRTGKSIKLMTENELIETFRILSREWPLQKISTGTFYASTSF